MTNPGIYWVPATLKRDEQNVVRRLLREEISGGGGHIHTDKTMPSFELLSHRNYEPVRGGTLRDAVAFFVDAIRPPNSLSSSPYPLPLPSSFVNNVRSAEVNGVGCECATLECTNATVCATKSRARGKAFTNAYHKYILQDRTPLHLTIRQQNTDTANTHTDTSTSTDDIHRFVVTFPKTTHPSFEDIRHGLIAQMHVSRVE